MKKIIFADHAATTQLDEDALQSMMPFLTIQYGNPSALYSFAREPRKAVNKARAIIAECIGAEPEEIYFTSGSTESDNWAIRGIVGRNDNSKRNIITSEVEHHAILRSCESLQKYGIHTIVLSVNQKGKVTTDSLKEKINSSTILVSLMMANNELGTISDVKKYADITHQFGAIFHTDAVQAVGHIPIDVKSLGIDLLSASAHKFNGPKGIGFLFIRKGITISPLLYGGPQEGNVRAGTENVAAIVGMATALKKHTDNLETEMQYLTGLEEYFREQLKETNLNYRFNGASDHIPGLISISFQNAEGEMLLHRLDLMGIEVATGSACNSRETEISYVLRAARIPENYINGTLRISLGIENTKEDIDYIVMCLARILSTR